MLLTRIKINKNKEKINLPQSEANVCRRRRRRRRRMQSRKNPPLLIAQDTQ